MRERGSWREDGKTRRRRVQQNMDAEAARRKARVTKAEARAIGSQAKE